MGKRKEAEQRHAISCNGSFHLWFMGYKVKVVGAPFRNFVKAKPTVCLLEEIPQWMTAGVHLPIQDFKTPEIGELETALIKSAALMGEHRELYVGCAGGYGRTGTFLAALVKIADKPPAHAVFYVRAVYHHKAVETTDQFRLVEQWKPSFWFMLKFKWSFVKGVFRYLFT
jgi:hypothetical protein